MRCDVIETLLLMRCIFVYRYVDDLATVYHPERKSILSSIQGFSLTIECLGGEVPFFYLSGKTCRLIFGAVLIINTAMTCWESRKKKIGKWTASLCTFRTSDQAYRTHDGVFAVVRHVRDPVPPVLDHPGSAVGAAGGAAERHHVRAELHRRHFVFRENRARRQRGHDPRAVRHGVPGIRLVIETYLFIFSRGFFFFSK